MDASYINGLVANAGGGQAGGTPMKNTTNRFTVVATAGDSATLPQASAGLTMYACNGGAQSMNVFPCPGTTDAINALAAGAALAVPAGKMALFTCAVNGTWSALLSA